MLTPNDDVVRNCDPKLLQAAREDDNRHRLHAEAATSERAASPYFRKWLKEFVDPVIVSVPKRKQLKKQFIWPPVTVELVDEIVDMASAVHHAEDRFIKVDLTDASLEDDFNAYAERIGLQSFITRNCHSSLFSRPNSLVVVDLPKEQVTPFPEPYVYLLPLDRVRAVKPLTGPSDSGLLDFVWFDTDEKDVSVIFDKTDIATFKRLPSGNYSLIKSVPHNQPYCPVFKMWDDVEDSNALTSNTMLRPLLGLLDRLIFWDGGTESNDLAAAFMMLWHYERTQENKPAPPVNLPGIAEDIRPTGVTEDGHPFRPTNPTCATETGADNTLYGPGTTLPVPAPRSKDDMDLRPPAGWIAPDVNSLKYIAEKATGLRQRIRQTATGYDGGSTGQPMNETQILKIIERSRIIYTYLAEHYEVLTRRVLETAARYRCGPYFMGLTVSLGRRVSLLTGDQLITLYKAAKDAGLGYWLLEELTLMQQEYFARSDASRKLRYRVMKDLTEYPNLSPSELLDMGVDQSDPEGYAIAVSLLGFIYRFERENDIPIEQFCNAPDYNKRVSQILIRFKSYVTERKPAETVGAIDPNNDDPNNDGNEPNGGTKPVSAKGGTGTKPATKKPANRKRSA